MDNCLLLIKMFNANLVLVLLVILLVVNIVQLALFFRYRSKAEKIKNRYKFYIASVDEKNERLHDEVKRLKALN